MSEKKSEVKNIITIGASAGGIEAVSDLLKTFKSDLDAAIFIVIHVSKRSNPDVILEIIQKNTVLKCIVPADYQEIENQTIYVAPADHHLLLNKGTIRVTKGAAENHWRPSIDVLFRSAAAAYTSCVTGIILTGSLDDGTSGMNAIKRCGGRCIVQDPEEALFPEMPKSVLQSVPIDYKLPLAEIGFVLTDLFARSVCEEQEVPADIQLEAAIASRTSTSIEDLAKLGDFTPLTCPDCGGVMVKVEGDAVPRYRCYTGHAFTQKVLESEQLKGIEESLWVSIRMMEQRRNLLLNIRNEEGNGDNAATSQVQDERIKNLSIHIDRLKGILLNVPVSTISERQA